MRGLSVWVVAVWGMAFALLILNTAVSLYNIEVLVANDRAVSQSRDVSEAMGGVVSSLKDEESGERGYLITEQERFLEPYLKGEEMIPIQLQRLRDLTQNDPFYESQLGRFTQLINDRRFTLRAVLNVHRTQGAAAARNEVVKGQGKLQMDRVLQAFEEMQAHEDEVLAERSRASRDRYRSSMFTSLLGGVLTVVMVAMAFILVRLELARRRAAELEAHDAVDHLASSELRFRTLTEAIPQMVWNADASGRVTYVNRRWVEYTGLVAADAVTSWWTQVAHPDDAARVEAAWRQAVAGKASPFAEEVRVRDIRDGSYHWFMTTIAPLHRGDGTIDQWIGSLSSIDDQKRQAELLATMVQMRTVELESANNLLREEIAERTRAEARVQATAVELVRSNEELEKFAYVASHDLQEPLRKIQAFADRLVKKYRENLAGDGREYLDRMLVATVRMRTLINDLLAYSRVSTNAMPFSKVNLQEVARDVVDDLGERIEQTGAQVDIGVLPTIDADLVQMRRLFQNLIGNALKFHKIDETPLVTIRATKIQELPPGVDPPAEIASGYRLTIADNGIGFDQVYADRVFELFQRLHGRGEYEGTGIGLAICRKIVQRHAGAISVRSREGAGATFYIDLPETAA